MYLCKTMFCEHDTQVALQSILRCGCCNRLRQTVASLLIAELHKNKEWVCDKGQAHRLPSRPFPFCGSHQVLVTAQVLQHRFCHLCCALHLAGRVPCVQDNLWGNRFLVRIVNSCGKQQQKKHQFTCQTPVFPHAR